MTTLSDIADTPFGHAFPDAMRAELTNLSIVFNSVLRDGLAQAPAKLIDTGGHGVIPKTFQAQLQSFDWI